MKKGPAGATVFPERFRVGGDPGGDGMFEFNTAGHGYRAIASSGMGWDLVSVSVTTAPRCPSWNEMKAIKEAFFDPEETVVQFHPKNSKYINRHPYVLHLWKKHGPEYELPPDWMV